MHLLECWMHSLTDWICFSDTKRHGNVAACLPLLLTCGHTFCTECLTKLSKLQKSAISCPSCQVIMLLLYNTLYLIIDLWQWLSTVFSSMWHLLRLSQGCTQGRPKCALGRLQKLTHASSSFCFWWCCILLTAANNSSVDWWWNQVFVARYLHHWSACSISVQSTTTAVVSIVSYWFSLCTGAINLAGPGCRIVIPLTSTWPHQNSAVGLEEGEY